MHHHIRIHKNSVRISHNVSGTQTKRHKGSGFKAVLHHRLADTHDPNIERLKQSLQNLSLHTKKSKGISSKPKYINF